VSSVSPGGISEDTYDPSIPPEKQIVTYQTKDGEIKRVTKLELQDQLQASEKLMEDLNLTWEEKMAATQAIHVAREKALEELGITVDKDMVGVHAPQKFPSLVNLNEDPLMSECLIYQLKPGTTASSTPRAMSRSRRVRTPALSWVPCGNLRSELTPRSTASACHTPQ
jgi:kinesin family protein 1